jgi:hypothetical protein
MCNRPEFKWGMHNKGNDRLSAIHVIWCFELILQWVYLTSGAKELRDLRTFYSIKWYRAYLITLPRRPNCTLINILTSAEKTAMQQASSLGGRGVGKEEGQNLQTLLTASVSLVLHKQYLLYVPRILL